MPLSHSCFLTSLFFSIFSLIPTFPLFFLIFHFFSFFAIFLTCFPYSFRLPSVSFISHYAQLRPFYTACCYEFYYFTPQLLLTWCGCPSQTTHWFVGYSTITTILYRPCHIPFPNKKVLFCFLALRGIPIRIRVRYSLLLTPMTCT